MARLWNYVSYLRRGLGQIAFPDICICCGHETLRPGNHICPFCLEERFEYARSGNGLSTGDVILPDFVNMQFALWAFDKGGMLQHLMHSLKYERLIGIGDELGRLLARRVWRHSLAKYELEGQSSILIPVPLHYLKFKKRGFNQAFYIAKGIHEVLSIPVCSIKAVRRKRYTQTQTGLALDKRIENVRDAFWVHHPEAIRGKGAIIVDDVFTTGATSFELAATLHKAGATSVMIWTLAQA